MREKLFIFGTLLIFLGLFLLQLPAAVASGPRPVAPADRPFAVPLTTTTPTASPTAPMVATVPATLTLTATSTLTPTVPVTPTVTPTPEPNHLFLPMVYHAWEGIPTLPDPLPAPMVFTSTAEINFRSASANLDADGLILTHSKIGFHIGPGGDLTGLSDSFQRLDAAGVPIFVKEVDSFDTLLEVQTLAKASGVPHVLVYRRTGGLFELPNYDNDPILEAKIHYDRLVAAWPAELDPSMVWMETVNEPDKNRSEWLAEYSLETARLAVADGRRVAAFSWSSGEPEPYHWRGPKMLEYLRYAADHKDSVAVSLHEYSYRQHEIDYIYPYLLGRFQFLFDEVDQRGIDRPTILITEWGWEYQDVPDVESAMEDIAWASRLYAAYPEVQGAAIWYLGGGYGGITDTTNDLIEPLADQTLSSYFGVTPGIGQIDMELFVKDAE